MRLRWGQAWGVVHAALLVGLLVLTLALRADLEAERARLTAMQQEQGRQHARLLPVERRVEVHERALLWLVGQPGERRRP